MIAFKNKSPPILIIYIIKNLGGLGNENRK